MNFLILTQYFPPEVGAAQTRLFEIAKELKKRGHSVTVVTAMPNYPKGEIFPEYRGKFFLKETISGIEVVRTWIYPAMDKSIIKRLMNYFSFTFTSFLGLMRTSKPDYIFVESPPLFLGIAGYIVSRIRGVPFIFNISDLWPDSVKELGIMNNKLLLSFAEKLELFLYKKARYIYKWSY
jgi:glycosyltransferase involved in cell wall biosynthesis